MDTEEEKNSGYKFAAAFLVATGSILYVIYDYIQNSPVSGHWYFVTCALIAGTFFSILGFLSYIFIEGYLVVVRDHIHAEDLNKIGTFLYKYSLLFIIFFIPGSMLVILMDTYPIIEKIFLVISYFIIVLFVIIAIIAIIFIILKKTKHKKPKPPTDQSRPFTKRLKLHKDVLLPIVWGVALFIFVCIVGFIASWPPFQGHVTIIDMESVHYKNDTQIPVLIQVTGPNTGLYAFLYKKLPGNLSNISDIYSIGPIEPIFVDSESNIGGNIESNNVLVGSYLGNGKYSVFINTTNLTTGYYELACLRRVFYEKTCESKSFYLLTRS